MGFIKHDYLNDNNIYISLGGSDRQYIHILQNLYFTIIGTELELKE